MQLLINSYHETLYLLTSANMIVLAAVNVIPKDAAVIPITATLQTGSVLNLIIWSCRLFSETVPSILINPIPECYTISTNYNYIYPVFYLKLKCDGHKL